MVLVPRDCLSKLKPLVDSGDMTIEEFSQATAIPAEFAAMTLQDYWSGWVEEAIG